MRTSHFRPVAPTIARNGAPWRGVANLFLLIGLQGYALASWPLTGAGDSNIGSFVQNGAGYDSGAYQAALEAIAESNPALSAAIGNSTGTGGPVSVVTLSANDAGTLGRADANTIALDADLAKDPDMLAQVLVHEWYHVRQINGDPSAAGGDDLFGFCFEAHAWAADYAFACAHTAHREAMVDELGSRPFTCVHLKHTHNVVTGLALLCGLSGGSPPAIPPVCGMSYCQ